MAVDWLAIRNDYINGGGSYRKMAEKYSVPLRTIAHRAKEEKWQELKETHINSIATALQQKTEEKISDALSEEAATKARIREKLIKMAETWIDNQQNEVHDPADYRRIVQSCVDMGIFDAKGTATEKSNNLLQAIQSIEEIDTDDLPEVE